MDAPNRTYVSTIHRVVTVWLGRTQSMIEGQTGDLLEQFPNVLRVTKQALACPETQTPQLIQLIKQSYWLAHENGRWDSWEPILEMGLAIFKAQQNPRYIELLIQLGKCYSRTRQIDLAIQTHNQAKMLAQQIASPPLYLESLYNLCFTYRVARRFEDALFCGEAALDAAQQNSRKSPIFVAKILNEIGIVYSDQGGKENAHIAQQRFQMALTYLEDQTAHALLIKTMINLGQSLNGQEKFEEALVIYRQVHDMLKEDGRQLDKGRLWNSYGITYLQMERYPEAEAAFLKANNPHIIQTEDIFYQASVSQNLGLALIKQNRLDEAQTAIWRAIRLWEQIGEEVWLANSYGTMGELFGLKSQRDEAVEYYDVALNMLNNQPAHNTTISYLIDTFSQKRGNYSVRPVRFTLGVASQLKKT